MAVKVGSFVKSTTTPGPVTQSVGGIGFEPKALILWTSSAVTSGTWVDSLIFAIGFAGKNRLNQITYGSACVGLQDGQPASVVSGNRTGSAALTMERWDDVLVAQCTVTSFDADGFTLNWTTNNSSAYIIHYMALGGEDLQEAKVVEWTSQTSTGNHSVNGVGFRPDFVFNLQGSASSALMVLGAMAATGHWNLGMFTVDGATTMDTQMWQSATAMWRNFSNSLILSGEADNVSLDADGFTVNFTDASIAGYGNSALCLKGGSYKIGAFTRNNGAGSQSVTGVGFRPEGVLNASWFVANSVTASAPTYFGIGATDGVGQQATAMQDDNGVADSNCAAVCKTNRMAIGADNNTKTIDAEATITSLNNDGWTMEWLSMSGNPSAHYLYFAFDGGPAPNQGGSKGKKPPIIKPPKGGGNSGKGNPNFRHNIWIFDE